MAVSSPCASAGESCTAKPTSSACFRVTNPTDKQRRQQDGGSHGDIGTPHMDEHGGGRRAAGDITAVGYRPRREPLAPGLQVFRRVDRRPPRGRESGEGAQDRIGSTMTTQDLRPGFVYTTGQAAESLGKSRCQVVRLCDAGDLWTWRRSYRGEHRRIALDIDATER